MRIEKQYDRSRRHRDHARRALDDRTGRRSAAGDRAGRRPYHRLSAGADADPGDDAGVRAEDGGHVHRRGAAAAVHVGDALRLHGTTGKHDRGYRLRSEIRGEAKRKLDKGPMTNMSEAERLKLAELVSSR